MNTGLTITAATVVGTQGEVSIVNNELVFNAAGDVNGDGLADILVGDPAGDTGYVVFGNAQGLPASLDLTALDGTNGFIVVNSELGAQGSGLGTGVSGIGDINADGLDDVILSAPEANSVNGAFSGRSYVVFGSATVFSAGVDVLGLDGSNGFRVDGLAFDDLAGFAVSAAGDVNADGFANSPKPKMRSQMKTAC